MKSRRGRAAITFVATQSSLVIAFAQQGSIKEMTALATVTLTFALVLLVIADRWPARAFLAPALSGLATVGALGPPGVAYVGPLLLIAAGFWLARLPRTRRRTALLAAGGVVLATLLLALPLLGGASTAVTTNNKTLSTGKDLGNLARPLDVLQASGSWVVGDYRYEPNHPQPVTAIAIAVCLVGLLGLFMAVRRRARGPLLLAGTMLPLSALLLLRGNPYADAKVLVLAAIVVPLFAMCAAVWLFGSGERRLRLLGAALGVVVTAAVLAGNALAYHDVQLAPYDRYEEQISIAEQLEGKGPVVFAEYDEFAKHFMRRSQVLSQPEWPFEFPIGPLNVKGAAAHVEKNRDGLHPSFKSPLDPDSITPSSLEAASYIVMRRSPTASRPPANYRLVRRGRYYEVWKRDRSQRVVFHEPLGRTVFAPVGRPRCGERQEEARPQGRAREGRAVGLGRAPAGDAVRPRVRLFAQQGLRLLRARHLPALSPHRDRRRVGRRHGSHHGPQDRPLPGVGHGLLRPGDLRERGRPARRVGRVRGRQLGRLRGVAAGSGSRPGPTSCGSRAGAATCAPATAAATARTCSTWGRW